MSGLGSSISVHTSAGQRDRDGHIDVPIDSMASRSVRIFLSALTRNTWNSCGEVPVHARVFRLPPTPTSPRVSFSLAKNASIFARWTQK